MTIELYDVHVQTTPSRTPSLEQYTEYSLRLIAIYGSDLFGSEAYTDKLVLTHTHAHCTQEVKLLCTDRH